MVFATVFETVDVLVTAGSGPAPRLGGWRPVQFWQASSPPLTTPFNVGGGPALVQCIGYEGGLPISMQIAGRHFEDGKVLGVAHAWRRHGGSSALSSIPTRRRRPCRTPSS